MERKLRLSHRPVPRHLLSQGQHNGARIDQGTIVSFAIGTGYPQKIAVLIEAGADIRYQREHGYDALVDAVQFLLKAGANANDLKFTPLIEAVASGSLPDVEAVIAFGQSYCLSLRGCLTRLAMSKRALVHLDDRRQHGQRQISLLSVAKTQQHSW